MSDRQSWNSGIIGSGADFASPPARCLRRSRCGSPPKPLRLSHPAMSRKPPSKPPLDFIDEKDDSHTQQLCDLALELAEQENQDQATLAVKQSELQKLIRKNLQQKQDEVLYKAIERARDADLAACQFLKQEIEDAAQTVLIRRAPDISREAGAFAIPLFVRTTGGLDVRDDFQDQPAFNELTRSFQQAQLESPDARAVLINHAYHLDEIDSITYSQLNEMIRDAAGAMTDKKISATPAIESSFTGWPERDFTPQDVAVELRFLLGFTLSSPADPFYKVPDDEAEADVWFAERARRFQAWSVQVAPLVGRCLCAAGREVEVNFLYQDAFFGAKERGMAEFFMLQMMAQLNQDLQAQDVAPEQARAEIGVTGDGAPIMRVLLHAVADGRLLASAAKPFDGLGDLQMELDDVSDALATLGITDINVAAQPNAGRAR